MLARDDNFVNLSVISLCNDKGIYYGRETRLSTDDSPSLPATEYTFYL